MSRIALRLRPLRPIEPFAAAIAEEIFHDAIFERTKADHCDPRAGCEPSRQNAQPLLKRTEFVVHFHAQRLKSLRRRMTTSVATNDFFNRTRERQRFTKRRRLARLHDYARDPARSRLLAQVAEQLCELFLAVIVNDVRSRGRLVPWIHPHIERTVAHHAETALGIFELARRHAKIDERAADRGNPAFASCSRAYSIASGS